MVDEERMRKIDRLLAQWPTEFSYRWCEPGPLGCACLGCVNLNGPLKGTGITKQDWEAWKEWKAKQ